MYERYTSSLYTVVLPRKQLIFDYFYKKLFRKGKLVLKTSFRQHYLLHMIVCILCNRFSVSRVEEQMKEIDFYKPAMSTESAELPNF